MASHPARWTPCSFEAHLDAVRALHEDLADRVLSLPSYLVTASPQELGDYVATVQALLEHLAGLHQDETLVRLTALETHLEPPADPIGVDCAERWEGILP